MTRVISGRPWRGVLTVSAFWWTTCSAAGLAALAARGCFVTDAIRIVTVPPDGGQHVTVWASGAGRFILYAEQIDEEYLANKPTWDKSVRREGPGWDWVQKKAAWSDVQSFDRGAGSVLGFGYESRSLLGGMLRLQTWVIPAWAVAGPLGLPAGVVLVRRLRRWRRHGGPAFPVVPSLTSRNT